MLTRRRIVAVVVLLVVAAAAYTAWLLYAAQRDLRAAEQDARTLRTALQAGDDAGAERALGDLQDSAGSAESHTGGWWWGALTVVPVYGDDLDGVRALSASLDEVAGGAAPALLGLSGEVEGLVEDGQVDVDGVRAVGVRLTTADESASAALDEVDGLDSTGFVDSLRSRFEDYVDVVGDVSRGLHSARTAAEVAPTMLGADGPRNYLLVFQNNAEIRSTGGLSGSWARLHTDDGRLELEEQGSAGDFDVARTPLLPVSKAEKAVYGDVIGQYFQDPLMVPDFPRAAALFDAFWKTKHADVDLDGVLTIDTVGLSYLLRGTGPVTTHGYTLTPDNVVQTMLNQVYLDVDDPQQQDAVFSSAAGAIFTAATTGVTSPGDLLDAVHQAVSERRLMVASFEDPIAKRLAGTQIAGELAGDDGATPHVDVTVNDATGSKMSYYLDYDAAVRATSCRGGVQQLAGTMSLRQTIPQAEAAKLPSYITGGGLFGVEVGTQQVLVRIYAPFAGVLGRVEVNGIKQPRFTVATIDDRQVMTLAIATQEGEDVTLDWQMTSGPGQSGAGDLQVTPKVTAGPADDSFVGAC